MKGILAMIVLGILSSVLTTGQTASASSDPRLTKEERAEVIRSLKESEKEFLEMVENLTDAQWSYKAALNKWSVGETAEHIMLSEGALFGAVEMALSEKPNPEWETKTAGKTEFLARIMPTRMGRAQAPEAIRPTSKLTREEVISRFKEVRARTLKFIETTDLPMKAHTFDHPFPVFGTLNAYQWLLYIPYHNLRHNKQIAEVKASPGFPK
ncbi:MAG: DinB family protein [Blastocatellia bacterium]|nr:DinB family protein [Blastocatellia bacterium]